MNTIINAFNQLAFIIAPIFYQLFFISITGTLVGIVVLILRHCFDKQIPPIWKYLMWAVVMVALLVPIRPHSAISVTTPLGAVQNISFRAQYDDVRTELFLYRQQEDADADKLAALQQLESDLYDKSLIFDVAIPLLWFFGLCLNILLFVGNKCYISHQIKQHTIQTISNTQKARFETALAHCKAQLGMRGDVQIILQDYISSPALVSWHKPTILLPSYATEMSNAHLHYVLLHELSHYKRHDMMMNYCLWAVQLLHWCNPFVWHLFADMREDMELLNDHYVLSKLAPTQHKDYAKSLVEMLGHSHKISPMPRLLCMVDSTENMERRITMIKRMTAFQKHKIAVSVCCLAILGVLCGLFLTQKEDAIQSDAISTDPAEIATLLSQSKSNILAQLGLTETDIQLESDGMFLLPDTQEIYGNDYSVLLCFDTKDKLYGCSYYFMVDTEHVESVIATFADIITQLREEYGEPDTYPNHPDQFSTTKNVTNALAEPFSAVFESWNLEQAENFVLDARLENVGENTYRLMLQYHLQLIP